MTDTDGICGKVVMTSDKVAAGRRVDLATECMEVGRFFEPIVKEKGLIGEGSAAILAFIALDSTESLGGVVAVAVEPLRIGEIEPMSATGAAWTEEVVSLH